MCRSSRTRSASEWARAACSRPAMSPVWTMSAPPSAVFSARLSASRNSGWSSATMTFLLVSGMAVLGAVRRCAGCLSAISALVDQILDHGWFGQGRGVAQIGVIVLGDLAQDTPHDLARSGLRQTGCELQMIRFGDRPDLGAYPLRELGDQFLA